MITPIGKTLLLKPKQQNAKFGIQLAGNYIEEQAEVVAIGDQVSKFKVGDTVYFKSWSTDKVKIKDQDQMFIQEEMILAKDDQTPSQI